jgi:hypothetical protein
VRGVGEQRTEGDHGTHPEVRGDVQQLRAVAAPPHGRLDPVHEDDHPAGAGGGGDGDVGGGPGDLPLTVVTEGDRRPVHLEVVVLLGVQLVDLLGAPRLVQVHERLAGSRPRVVPSLEGGEQHGLALGGALVLVSLLRHPASLGRLPGPDASGARADT